MCERVAEFAAFPFDRFTNRRHQPEPVRDAVRRHQADRRTAVVQREHAEVEGRPPLRIDRDSRALLDPGTDLVARTAGRREVDAGCASACHPSMTPERQLRALYSTPQDPCSAIL